VRVVDTGIETSRIEVLERRLYSINEGNVHSDLDTFSEETLRVDLIDPLQAGIGEHAVWL
jgi:hypothetical protein